MVQGYRAINDVCMILNQESWRILLVGHDAEKYRALFTGWTTCTSNRAMSWLPEGHLFHYQKLKYLLQIHKLDVSSTMVGLSRLPFHLSCSGRGTVWTPLHCFHKFWETAAYPAGVTFAPNNHCSSSSFQWLVFLDVGENNLKAWISPLAVCVLC